ncbi:hypothetical protein SteCoe_30009 [Stentor coeruleus]|uniref:GAR domain-containing protein n=1 Tax=Stentor coeruleus TaxID=5963 RepID=A0A1R2B4I1_9CILI|nr:hypothetical protein SteCoe_30009 [Stentor coeruleus]
MESSLSLELEVADLKLLPNTDISKAKCIITVNNYTQCLSYPFNLISLPQLDNFSILEISITYQNQVIAGLEVPLSLFRNKKQQTFKLTDFTAGRDKRKLQTKGRNDSMEITLNIKQVSSNTTLDECKTEIEILEKKVKESEIIIEEGMRSRREMQKSFEKVTRDLAKMIRSQEDTINNLVSEKEKICKYLESVENDFKSEKIMDYDQVKKCENVENINYKSGDLKNKQRGRVFEIKRGKSYENSPLQMKKGVEKDQGPQVAVLKKTIEVLQIENEELRKRNEELVNEMKNKNRFEDDEMRVSELTLGTSVEKSVSDKMQTSESLVLSLRGDLAKMSVKYKSRISKLSESRNIVIQENKDLCQKINYLNDLLSEKDQEISKLQYELNLSKTPETLQNQASFPKLNPHKLLGKYVSNIKKVENMLSKSPRLGKENEESFWAPKTPEPYRKTPDPYDQGSKDPTITSRKSLTNPIDLALYDFMAIQKPSLPIKFIKDCDGIYIFGTKKVFIKLDNGKLYIRIGGGFMIIDEFIKVFMGQEIDKLARENEKFNEYLDEGAKNDVEEKNENANMKNLGGVGLKRRSVSVTRFSSHSRSTSNINL